MDSFNINQKIDKLYNKNGLMEKYGGQVFLTIIIFFVVGVAFVYLQVLNNLEPVKKNWGKERCNPFVIPLAGFINNTEKNKKTDGQYTVDNFEFCLGNIIESSFQFIIDSFRFILSGIMTLFEDIFTILKGIIAWFLSIIQWILGFLENIWGLTLQNFASLQSLLNRTRDSFSKAIGMLIVVLYVKMLSFRMTIMWMITTPIFMLFTVVTGILVKILLHCLKSQALTMAKWMKYMFCVAKQQLMSLMGVTANSEAGQSVIQQGLSTVQKFLGIGLDAAGVAEEAIPIVGQIMSAASFAGAVAAFMMSVAEGLVSILDAIAGIVMAIGSALLYAFGLGQCGVSVTQTIYRAYTMMTLMAQVVALVISLLLIILLWGFNKVVLGQMNIPGQGIPGLSF